jgi:glycopeptide antibiotics resistance protein
MTKIITKLVLKICFAAYLLLVCFLLFFKVGSTERSSFYINPDDHFIPFQGTVGLIELAQQYNFQKYYLRLLINNVGGNLILLLPFGFISPLIFKTIFTITRITLIAFLLSFSAELIQWVFTIGIFDVDDILYNSFGAALGFLLSKQLMAKHN